MDTSAGTHRMFGFYKTCTIGMPSLCAGMPLITTQYALNIKRRETLKSVTHRAYGRMPCVFFISKLVRVCKAIVFDPTWLDPVAGSSIDSARGGTQVGSNTRSSQSQLGARSAGGSNIVLLSIMIVNELTVFASAQKCGQV